jgi:PAS domain S-box-containing protein
MGNEALVLRLAERIYAAALETEGWGLLLEELSEALGGAAIQLSLRIPERGPTEPGPLIQVHLDPKYRATFLRLALEAPPWMSLDKTVVQKRFAPITELADWGPVEETAFYREFMQPQGLAPESPICHIISTSPEGRPLAGIVVYRREGGRPLGGADFELLDLLVPHLGRAYRIHCQLGDVRHEQRALRQVIDRLPAGVILLDKDGRVVLANRSADQIFGLDDGIRLERGRPRLADPRQDRAFQQVIARAVEAHPQSGRASGSTIAVARPSGRRAFPCTVSPLLAAPPGTSLREAVAILFVADPEGSQITTTEVLEGLYDLTPAEAELLRLLAEGRSLDEVAALRGVTMNTVRSQLKQVFAKTDTRRQGQLVHLVLTGVASFGDDGER